MKLSKIVSSILVMGVALFLTNQSFGGKGKLAVGDAAPGLDIEEWVKGEETALESGNVYVVEFWATYCAACKKSIPHLTELQNEYDAKGLKIIGISQEEPDVVKRFVRSQGDGIKYTIAVDRRKSSSRAWMNAADRDGIPAAFIVDRQGKLAFIGHPLDEEFETILKRVLTGRFNPVLEKKAAPLLQAARQARQVRNWRMAEKHYDEVVALDAAVFASAALEKFEMYLVDMEDRDKAYDYAQNTIFTNLFANDAGALQMLAEKIVLDPKIENADRNMDLALEAVEAALNLSGKRDAGALAAVAMVQYHRGDVERAISLQKQAYFSASPKHKQEYRRTLTNYQEAAFRTSMNKGK